MVLADGRQVTASPDRDADLFWAIRGGGNFGIVTSFLFRLHPVSTVVGDVMLWPLDDAAEVMAWYGGFIHDAPNDLNGFLAMMVVPPGPPFPEDLRHKHMCGIVWCYTGPRERFDRDFAPVRRFRPPAFEHVGPVPFPALQRAFDAFYPPGLQQYWRADFVKELGPAAIAEHVKHASAIPTTLSAMRLYPVNGAAHDAGPADTAWNWREATWEMVILGAGPDPANKDRIVDWAKAYWETVHPYSAGGAYVNFMMEEGDDRVRATYGPNYARLAAIKRTHDPTSVFRVNQNIRPAPAR